MRPKLVAIKVSGGHLIPVIMRAAPRRSRWGRCRAGAAACRRACRGRRARRRGRAGYTVIPHSNSMTSPLPLVVARPVPLAMTRLRALRLPFFGRPAGLAGALWRSCGVSVGILVRAGAACVMAHPSLPAFSQVRGLTITAKLAPAPRLELGTCRLTEGCQSRGSRVSVTLSARLTCMRASMG